MTLVKAEEIERVLHELEQVKKRRHDRGDLFVDVVLEASKSIKDKYEKWCEKAIADLYKEIQLMNELVPYEELDSYKSDLLAMEQRFSKNREALNRFIGAIEHRQIKSVEDIIVPSGGSENTLPPIPSVHEATRYTIDFSVVLESLSIAKNVEEFERKVEKLSHFMMNVIMLTKRVS